MIHSLGVKNFSSFHEATLVDFTVGAKAGDRDIFLESSLIGTSVNSVTGIFGPNASGKTNLLKAIAFIRFFILWSASERPGEPIAVEPFEFTTKKDDLIHFRLEFELNSKFYRYELELNTQRVFYESLHTKGQRFRYLFERKWNAKKQKYDAKSQDIGPTKQIAQRENASFLSSALLQDHSFAKEIAAYFEKCYTNIHRGGRMDTHEPEFKNVLNVSEFYRSNSEVLKIAEQHLIALDLGISQLSIEEASVLESDGREKKLPFPVVEHSVDNESYVRPLFQESQGTQSLFVLLRYILPVLEIGGVAIIDELETGLHSHMVKYVVDLFYSKETNPNGAQLIANFHTDYLLQSTLEKYQIVFTEKNSETQSTETWRLDKVKGAARNANNHHAKYHAGAYGAIPNFQV